MATLGETIRTARKDRGMSALTLALELGVTQATVSRLENDEYAQAPKPQIARAIEEKLGIPESQLLRSMGYRLAEETPPYDARDPEVARIARAVAKLTPDQRRRLLAFIDSVTAVMDALDPPDPEE